MNRTDPEAQVRELVENWMAAIRRRDLDAVVANHSPDVVFFDVPEPAQILGIEAYRKSWQDFLGWLGASGRFEFEGLGVTASDGVAFCQGIVQCAGGGGEDSFPVRLTIGCRKVDGGWVITHEHHSVPAEP